MDPALPTPAADTRTTVEQFFGLVDRGLPEPDDRVELLEGVVVPTRPSVSKHKAPTTTVRRGSREKGQAHRDRRRAQGLRPAQVWVPETHWLVFAAEARRRSRLVAASRLAGKS